MHMAERESKCLNVYYTNLKFTVVLMWSMSADNAVYLLTDLLEFARGEYYSNWLGAENENSMG